MAMFSENKGKVCMVNKVIGGMFMCTYQCMQCIPPPPLLGIAWGYSGGIDSKPFPYPGGI